MPYLDRIEVYDNKRRLKLKENNNNFYITTLEENYNYI